MQVLLDDRIAQRPGASRISRSDIFYRRGIVLQELLEHDIEYVERDFISSYTLAMSVADKFSQDVKKGKAGIALGRGVSEIALQAPGTSICASVPNSLPEISRFASAFSKRMGVNLVRHRGRSGSAGDGNLREVAKERCRSTRRWRIQNAAGASNAVVQFRLAIVRPDLGGERVEAARGVRRTCGREPASPRPARRPGAPTTCRWRQKTSGRAPTSRSAGDALQLPRGHPISLPIVVGVAGCPWGRASVRVPRCDAASAVSEPVTALELGRPDACHRALRGESIDSGVDVVARAREVRQFADSSKAYLLEPIADEVSTAWTSWRVVASSSASGSISAWPKSVCSSRSRALSAAPTDFAPNSEHSGRVSSHSASRRGFD